MPCSGCSPFLAQHTGTFLKYWCESTQSYHFDWETCPPEFGDVPGKTKPLDPYSPPSYGEPYDPNVEPYPVAGSPNGDTSLAPLAMTGRNCGCCGSGGSAGGTGPAGSAGGTGPAGSAGGTGSAGVASGAGGSLALSIAKQCGCGYTNKEAILAIAAAFVVFLLWRK